MIYHITTKEHWELSQIKSFFEVPSLQTEGFIHNCTIDQIPGVLDRYYKNQHNLLLLHIDEEKLQSPLKYELAPSVNEYFPHIFGPINLDAVIKTADI